MFKKGLINFQERYRIVIKLTAMEFWWNVGAVAI